MLASQSFSLSEEGARHLSPGHHLGGFPRGAAGRSRPSGRGKAPGNPAALGIQRSAARRPRHVHRPLARHRPPATPSLGPGGQRHRSLPRPSQISREQLPGRPPGLASLQISREDRWVSSLSRLPRSLRWTGSAWTALWRPQVSRDLVVLAGWLAGWLTSNLCFC